MVLYKNRYRVESSRLKDWDYSSSGYYYLTICTRDRICYFGDVVNGKMVLSPTGEAVYQCWQEIPKHFSFVRLDGFIIMPNHVHGIIIIDKTHVETQNLASLRYENDMDSQKPNEPQNKFGPQSKNIASIIRGFKIGVTKFAKKQKIPFGWQPRFYDHIVRDEKDLNRIRQYMVNNPTIWKKDDLYQQG
ncbi:MAG: hypothetical protein MAG551_00109 [Candidatus Scalindua arabica]|uniref:Transposase IS200-like domain-containing protein n=1 Tax=Candidatus Scalindua arabica TaxID=1127984 RepID=A0A941VYG7_9BACT|nr:hypothetical protein [Candidatus Scalindua arabica]